MSHAKLIARARQLEPLLNAFVTFCEPASTPGKLKGLPYAAKDIFAAPDRQPCGGLGAPLPPMDSRYADVLRRLDQAGAARIGYTALTEIAYEPSGYNSVHGRVRNPWNLDFVSGGSSSGSAAAVASMTVTIALGSDTGGSLRIPAHCCGITGWKPTWGAVSTRGAMPLAPTLDTIGLLARGAAEMIPAAAVLADLGSETPVRSGVVIRDALAAAHPSIAKACQDGIDAIASCGIALNSATASSQSALATSRCSPSCRARPRAVIARYSTATRSARCCGAASPRDSTSMTRPSRMRWRSGPRSRRHSSATCCNPPMSRSCR